MLAHRIPSLLLKILQSKTGNPRASVQLEGKRVLLSVSRPCTVGDLKFSFLTSFPGNPWPESLKRFHLPLYKG